MKRIMSLLLSLVMLMGAMPVFAVKEDSENMQEVLLLVKEKITIPAELSEFSGNVSEYDGRVFYHFEWASEDYEKFMSVSSDGQGRITSYHRNTAKMSDKKLSKVSKEELVDFAEQFLKTTVPEAFLSETDCLVYNEDGYYASGNLRYQLGFERQKDGIPVKDNDASIQLCVVEDEIQVRSMNLNFAYDAEFESNKQDLEDYTTKYVQQFPAELIYRDEYQPLAKGKEAKAVPALIYRIKDDNVGYMDSSSGEVLTEDAFDDSYRKETDSENAVADMGVAGGGSSLTPQERAELEKVEGLLSKQELEKRIKKLPYIDFPDTLKLQSSSLYQDSFGTYYYRMNYSTDKEGVYQYCHIKANAKTGELTELSNDSGRYEEEKTLTEGERKAAEKKIQEFLTIVAKEKFAETEKTNAEEYGSIVSEHFVRMVNGIQYIDNGIRLSFDAKNSKVKNYSLSFTDGEFADPDQTVGDAAAYETILDYAPITPVYIKHEGIYKKVFTLSKRSIAVDAISGEIKNKEAENEYTYTDLSGHWAEEAARKLSEIQVGLPGGKLEPEQNITQEEWLRLLASAAFGQFYSEYPTEQLYEMLLRDNIIKPEEQAPESVVKREDAFVFVIRMAGLEKVAKLTDIFRVTYHDQTELSEGKLGYAAILSGLGVICGDGGNLRPQDALTRAEAMMMTYRYLLS